MEKKEDRYEEALETAQDIHSIENVMIQTVTTQMAFSSMMNGLEKGDYVIPGFQRLYRWREEQAEELAVSLVRGMPIPPIYCYRNREQQIVILDGQQRILSLYFYYIGKFLQRQRNAFVDFRKITDSEKNFREELELCGLKEKIYCMKYEAADGNTKTVDITYQKLSSRLKRRIDFAPITLIEINVDSREYREKTLHKIFANLNIGGTPLSPQELRNGIYHCRFYDMLYEVNDTCKKWRFLFGGNQNADINKESKDVETLLKMCAFYYYTEEKDGEFILTQYRGKISTLLDDFSEKARDFEEEEIADYQNRLLQFFDCLESVSGQNKNWVLVSFFVVWNHMEDKVFISKQQVQKIVESSEYSDTISKRTSDKGGIEKRLRSVYEQLSGNA